MKIFNWYGLSDIEVKASKSTASMEQLLSLYMQALASYFDTEPLEEANSFFTELSKRELDVSDKMFVQWLTEKALPTIQNAIKKGLPNDEEFVAQLEYESIMLQMEIKNGTKGNVCLRDCLIDMIDYLPERIRITEDLHVIIDKFSKYGTNPWIIKGNHIVMKNESVSSDTDSFIL